MLRIGPVQLSSNLILAPIAGYCDLAFRLVVRRIPGIECIATSSTQPTRPGKPGPTSAPVGLTCTELLCPQALLRESDKSLWRAATSPEDQPLCMQLYGADADILAQAAAWAEEHGATTIDINMGCPVDKVTKKNGGSMLLCDPLRTVALARHVVQSVRIPVTAKLRLGWDDPRIVAPTLAPALADVGIAAITVHGRTTEQLFRGQVRLDGIAAVVEAMKKFPGVPVIGNGDIRTPEDARRMMAATGCHGVMIGRGALGQPWIFRDTAHYLTNGVLPEPLSQAQRARIVLDHFDTLMRQRDACVPQAHALAGKPPPPEMAPSEGGRVALHMMHARISWYSPHLQPWPNLKRDVRALDSPAAFRAYMLAAIDHLDGGLPATNAARPPRPSSLTPATFAPLIASL
jgi:nifR3 family TIM-barrel protein